MRRAAIAGALAVLAVTAVPASAGSVRTTAIGAGLREYGLSLYRDGIRAGYAKFNVTNFGEDPHDLVVRTRGGRVVGRLPVLDPGEERSGRVRLRRGRYVVFCSIADHEALGMRARLTVRR